MGVTRRRSTAWATAAVSTLVVAGLCSGACSAAPASGTTTVPDASGQSVTAGQDAAAGQNSRGDALLTVGVAAVGGAGYGAERAMAAAAEEAMEDLARAAFAVPLPGTSAQVDGAQVGSGPTWTWYGWQSGAAGTEAEDGSFGTWRGSPVSIIGVWCDTDAETQTNLDAVADYDDYDGSLDVAVGALVQGETWQEAAAGDFVPRWTTAIEKLKAMREGKGITYIRIAHEMNGNWMPWSVTSANLAAYKAGYRLYASIVRKIFPEARLTWSPNGGNHSNVSVAAMYPGSDVVDVIGPDIYDSWPEATTPALWTEMSNYWQSPQSPGGLAAWQQWVASMGKPLALPEWGLPYGDHPDFIDGVHAVLAAHPGLSGRVSNAGRVVYDVYFNAEDTYKIYDGPNTASGDAYKSMTWGN